ncbi:MAG TPA: hypothetical protein VHY30_07220, partial [Verrucomicrobiae bacterium]|nr:hypothetical protein [Verrucomicrobiae bacterium]
MDFPTKIPVSIPWTSSEWLPKTVGQLLDDDNFFDFIEAWKRELHGSGRQQQYIAFIAEVSGLNKSDKLSPNMLRQILV